MFKQENYIFTVLTIAVIVVGLAVLINKTPDNRLYSNDEILFGNNQVQVSQN